MKNIVIGFSEQKVQMSEKNDEGTQNVNKLHAKTRGETHRKWEALYPVSCAIVWRTKDKLEHIQRLANQEKEG